MSIANKSNFVLACWRDWRTFNRYNKSKCQLLHQAD